MSKYYLIRTEWAGVSLERATSNVPDDGRYHIVVDGKIVKSLKSQKAAIQAYKEAIQSTGKEPPASDDTQTRDRSDILRAEDTAAQYYASAEYWGSSHSYSGVNLRAKK